MNAQTDRIYKDVAFLTEIMPARNAYHVSSLDKAANYIERVFIESGAVVEQQVWTASGNEYKNIITSYNQDKTKRLVIGAHYDVCGDQPGADDNASAVAGLLELVRLIFAHKPEVDYRIDFVAYSLEEPPFFGTEYMGSYIHARSLYKQQTDVLGMICLEMIGYFSDAPDSQPFPSPELAAIYPHTANFIIVVGIEKYAAYNKKVNQLMSADAAIDVQLIDFPSADSLAGLSDQRNYWRFGYQALMINDTAFVRNPNYHKKSDTIDTLDFAKMTEVINSTYRAITNFI